MTLKELLATGKQSAQGINIYRNKETEIWRYNSKRRNNRIFAEESYKNLKYISFPLHIIIEPTNNCNMMCEMCLRNVMTRPKGYMDWSVFVKVVDECSKEQVHSFSLYMLGEPLLHPDIREMINYSKRMTIPYVDVSTNALRDMKCLLGTALDELIISLDGIDNETYAKNRRSDYSIVEENILSFLEAKKKGSYEYPLIRLQIIDMESTRPYLEQFIDKWLKKVDVIYVKKLEGMVQGLNNKLVSPEDVSKRLENRKPCKELYFTHNINWNGDHAFCCHDPKGMSILGNMNNMSIKQAWCGYKKELEMKCQKQGVFRGLCKTCVDYDNW
uniref:Putative radical SAM superfamily protein n=2 Tax=viral metagenome TaxID=1070528 RepID=A0A6M3IXE7_9ZZZZ